MEKDLEPEIKFFESELDLCNAFLDIAGPKPLTNLIAKARLGYETVLLGPERCTIRLSWPGSTPSWTV